MRGTPKQLKIMYIMMKGSEGHLDITTTCPGISRPVYDVSLYLLTLKPFCCSYYPGSRSYGESGKVGRTGDPKSSRFLQLTNQIQAC